MSKTLEEHKIETTTIEDVCISDEIDLKNIEWYKNDRV